MRFTRHLLVIVTLGLEVFLVPNDANASTLSGYIRGIGAAIFVENVHDPIRVAVHHHVLQPETVIADAALKSTLYTSLQRLAPCAVQASCVDERIPKQRISYSYHEVLKVLPCQLDNLTISVFIEMNGNNIVGSIDKYHKKQAFEFEVLSLLKMYPGVLEALRAKFSNPSGDKNLSAMTIYRPD